MRDATQVTSAIEVNRIPRDRTTSATGRLPAAHRTGMAIGALNGISDRVTASGELGSLIIANIAKNDTMSRMLTGCWVWRASCSLEEMAPTAANIAEERKKSPRKYATNI